MPPPLRLTQQQLTAALQGLSQTERLELLQLLEQQESAEAERPIDDRPPLWRLFSAGGDAKELEDYIRAAGHDPANLPDGPLAERLTTEFQRDQAAAQSIDPDGFRIAWAAHRAAMERHLARLETELPPFELPLGEPFNVEDLFRAHVLDPCQSAEDLARADGFPPPEEVVPMKPEPAAEPAPHDPLNAARHVAYRRASLPRATLADIEESRVTHAESATYEFIRAEQQRAAAEPIVVDKLAAFRDKSPSGMPPCWPDF